MRHPWAWWDRRVWILLIAASVVAVSVAMGVGDDLPWLGSWKSAIDWSSGSIALVGPVLAGLAGWQYTRFRTDRLDVPLTQSPRSVSWWLEPAAAVWLVGVAIMLVTAAVAGVIADSRGSTPSWPNLLILVLGASALAAQVTVGAFVGTRFPGLWAAPVSAVLAFLLATASSSGLIPETFRTGGATSTLVGQVYDVSSVLAQSAIAVGLTAVLATACLHAIDPVPWRPSLVPCVVLTVVGVVAWGSGAAGAERFAVGDVELTCRGDGPQVCMASETTRPLDRLVSVMSQYAEPLRAAGATLPDRWVQDIPLRKADLSAGVIIFVDSGEAASGIDNRAVAISLASPSPCPQASAEVPDYAFLDAQALVADWVLVRNGLDSGLDPEGGRYQWITSDASLSWIRSTYASLSACRSDIEEPAQTDPLG